MPFARNRTPSYRLHKGSGQAVVTLDGRDIYLGVHGTKTSRDEYDRAIAEWLANGRSLRPANFADVTITEILARFWGHVEAYYRLLDGSPSSEIHVYRSALKPLRRLYGHTLAREFGPLALKTLRGEMIRLGWCRKVVNKQIGRIKNAFKWAVANELIPPSVFHGLAAVNGLRAGRSDAPESEPVRPVPEEYIRAVFPHVSAQIRNMIEVQLLTGMRPGEVCMMRGSDIDTTGGLWTYRPAHHKTQHHGHERVIYLGPKMQDVIRPFLKPDLQAYLFSPMDAEAARRDERHAFRRTPLKYGNRPGTNRKKHPKRGAGSKFTVSSYRRAIARACEAAFKMPDEFRARKDDSPEQKKDRSAKRSDWRAEYVWHPHQLRHNAATRLRKDYGLEAAQVILGHKTLAVTEIYAEKNVAAAQRIMAEVG